MKDYRVLTRQLPFRPDPVAAFESLSERGNAGGHFLLETADGKTPDAGKSLLLLSPCVRIVCWGPRVQLHALTPNGCALIDKVAASTRAHRLSRDESTLHLAYPRQSQAMDELERLCSPSPFDAIRAVLYGLQPENDDDARHLVAGGAFSFESVELFENFAPFRNDRGEPTFVLFVPELLLQIPRSGNSATLAAVVFSSDSSERSENDLSRRLSTIAVKLRNLAARPRGAATEASVEPTTDVDDEAFASRVMKAKEHLARGDAFQIVLSRSFTTPCPDPFDAYLALRQMNPSPYLFYGNEGRSVMFGASPETAVVVDGDARRVEVCPIAGTRARGRLDASTIDLDLDARIEAELRADPKEIAEHMMLVDLARNDVARISQAGSRKVSDLLAVERYSRVMHLVSRVDGILRPELDALHAFAASMPMGTLSGAPKIRAIEIIRELEGKPRGHYGGAVGYLDAAGNMTTSIFIRAAVVREGRARVQAGAGIVLGSEPALEAAETRQKAEAVLRAVAVSQTRRGTHAA